MVIQPRRWQQSPFQADVHCTCTCANACTCVCACVLERPSLSTKGPHFHLSKYRLISIFYYYLTVLCVDECVYVCVNVFVVCLHTHSSTQYGGTNYKNTLVN